MAAVARCGYETIIEYTHIRREEIRNAIELLIATQLIRFATDDETKNRKGDPAHNRYFVLGLNKFIACVSEARECSAR